ncbi:hypothetical protein [Enterobacter bugandensis]|uniref:hypothetical protein n=1 Tax=Enterobacter bugandensis TaxID=881260 RepID=UPI001F445A4A|nr:hypothetical protein [Enterobacter bugandensis]
MNGTFWFDLLKYLLPFLSGVVGVLGILNVFKTPQGRLSAWGWVAIVFIIISTFAGFFLTSKEKKDSEVEKKQLQSKLDKLILDVVKVKQPIGSVKLFYWTIFPDSSPEVIKYKGYIKDKIEHRKSDDIFSKRPSVNRDLVGSVVGVNSEIAQFDINPDSIYWPSSKFPEIRSLVSVFSISLCVSLNRVNLDNFRFLMGGRSSKTETDWCASGMPPGDNTIFYDVKSDKLGLMTTVNYKKEFIYSNGSVTSVRDFYGADVFFGLPSSGSESLKTYMLSHGATKETIVRQERIAKIINGMVTKSLLLDLGNGQGFTIQGKYLKRNKTEFGRPYFYLTTPANDSDMNKLAVE